MKHLLPQTCYYKANLHTHSTISDGRIAPEAVKQAYKEKGYQILAMTDHNIAVDHSNMNDADFLMLTGVEVDITAQHGAPFAGQTYHLNLIAKKPGNVCFPVCTAYDVSPAPDYIGKMQCEKMDLQCNPEDANKLIARANEMGFLVIYNHPTWSCQSYPDYASLKGLWALEIRNSESIVAGINENNARVYKDLLNLGNRLYPIGADDMHKEKGLGLSWIMVGAKELSYPSVIEALEKGDFYMSCGPEIFSLSAEGRKLKITCSDARQITLESHGRFSRRLEAEGENWLREAELDIGAFLDRAAGFPDCYVNVTVTAPDGSYATTRAYYLEEL